MAASGQHDQFVSEEYVEKGSDKVVAFMGYAIFFLIVCLLTLALYAVWAGVLSPPAPRTLVEARLTEAKVAVKQNPAAGLAWATLARAQWASGDKSDAWSTLTLARKSVKDRTILLVNLAELDFLLAEKKYNDVLKKVDGFIRTEADAQIADKKANAAKGILVPDQVNTSADTLRLFVDKATAQGAVGKWKDAVSTLDTALQLDDNAADVIVMRGWAKLNSGDKTGATTDFKRGLMFLPNDPQATAGLKQAETTTTK